VGVQRRPAPADGGWSLIETMVSMALTAIAGAIFTAGFLQIYSTFQATQAQSAAQQQLTIAFLRLDREVQYAAELSLPAQVGADWYAEYLIGVSDPRTCVELRLNAASRQLQRRTWTNGTTISPTPWVPVASDVAAVATGAGATVAPFVLLPADASVTFHRLQVTMASTAGRQFQSSWPALNATTGRFDDICTSARDIP
jgi:type II secretory pathway pseudopilin PulG